MKTNNQASGVMPANKSLLKADVGDILRMAFQRRKQNISQATLSPVAVKAPGNPYKEALIYGLSAVVFSTLFIYLVYIPMNNRNIATEQRLVELYNMQKNIGGFTEQIAGFKKKLHGQKGHYQEIMDYFSNSKDLGKLYQSVTTLSSMYQMTVMSIQESGTDPLEEGSPIEAIHVEVELKGAYSSYLQFKEELSQKESLLHIEKESLQVGQDISDPGMIYVKLEFVTYAIDKKPFLEAIADYE